MTNSDKLAILLKRKRGVTAAEVARALPTTSPHSSISRMQYTHGWTVLKRTRPDGQKVYFGIPPFSPTSVYTEIQAKIRKAQND